MAEVDHSQFEGCVGGDALDRLTMLVGECCAQGFMTVHNLVEALLKNTKVQRAGYTKDDGNVVDGAAGSPLVQEPKPLLGE
jgi:hypothetical protein